MKTKYKRIILASCLFLIFFVSSSAAPSDLDVSFGSGGKVVTPISYPPFDMELPLAMQLQPDGKIVIAGYLYDSYGNNTDRHFLARYHPFGALDTSFGINGIAVQEHLINYNRGSDIALQPDGRIVAVGEAYSYFSGPHPVFIVQRFHANGSPDESFGTGGIVYTETSGGALSVAVQPDGKIVVVGGGLTVARYNTDGSLDASFGSAGVVITAVGNDPYFEKVILQADGKIVAVGSTKTGNDPRSAALVRYNTDGSLDQGFGNGGMVIHEGGGSSSGSVLQPDGKIIAADTLATGATYATSIVRYNPNGAIDTSFATNGVLILEDFSGADIALQPDGRIVVFGRSLGTAAIPGAVALARLDPNGTFDAGFGNNGRIATPIGKHPDTAAVDGTVQPDGKILLFGVSFNSTYDSDIALVRYLGESAAFSVSISGRVTTTGGRGVSGLLVMLDDGAENVRIARTSAFGYFAFSEVPPGNYTATVNSKRYRFAPRAINVTGPIDDLFFTGPQ